MLNDIVFRGIIDGQGRVVSFNIDEAAATLLIDVTTFPEKIEKDMNIAVNGVCLTVQSVDRDILTFRLWPATLEKTNLRQLGPGMAVNLERNRY